MTAADSFIQKYPYEIPKINAKVYANESKSQAFPFSSNKKDLDHDNPNKSKNPKYFNEDRNI